MAEGNGRWKRLGWGDRRKKSCLFFFSEPFSGDSLSRLLAPAWQPENGHWLGRNGVGASETGTGDLGENCYLTLWNSTSQGLLNPSKGAP